MGKLSTCAQIFRVIFLVITGVFLLCGIAILAIGIYLQVESRNYTFITGSDYVSGPALLITSGIGTILISAVGFIGAILRWRPLLVIYAVVLIAIIILEIAAGIVGYVFDSTTADESEDRYRDRWDRAIREFDTNSDARDAVDFLQEELECCGIDNPMDWSRNGDYIWGNDGNLPESCQCDDVGDNCGVARQFYYNYTGGGSIITVKYNSTNNVWTEGCYNATVDVIVGFALLWGGVGIAFGIVEIIGIIIAFGLVCCITCAKNEKEYV